ncbi:helicase-associated domain-containing protein [Streptacidiphilus fuscans]|uniref:Helicase-associated domain-containing protein n=1 Tax=Streptacidiphilus fuscans TaxID=2789292 RepID=A0A931FHU0_9ACTN|nr:helicase-associated domain-containing protein [Streptacidiphilus fuscans]MBF9072186.1 helicase-associated domain-containing protein [Streptacidiphilus fuscans]MBF9072997.1 helicase-associated domain-containing protein [Streptacidiphilus fuscans]
MSTGRTDGSRAAAQSADTTAADGASSAPRTLAEDLRGRDDAALAALLRSRPDLVHPVPADVTQLATRSSTRASVVRALERLDLFTLQVAEALAVASDPCAPAELYALLGVAEDPAAAAALAPALVTLREAALLWGTDERLRLIRTARDVLAPAGGQTGPTGLGPTFAEAGAGLSPGRLQEILADAGLPSTHDQVSALASLSALFRDRTRADALLGEAPEGARGVLNKLLWGPPFGATPPRAVRAAEARTPVEWLQARGFLLPAGRDAVVLPREVALYLRGGLVHRQLEPTAPEVAITRTLDADQADRAAAAQAFTAVRTVEEALDLWSTDSPPVLRAGGLGVRELRRTAQQLDISEQLTAFWLELAYGAGLLAPDGEADERWAPTPAYDEWLRRPVAERWLLLARTWLTATRVAALVGGRDAKDKVLPALGSGLDRALAPEIRRDTLLLLAALPVGSAGDAGALTDRLRWAHPLRGGELRDRLVTWTVDEAELLGLTGRGALARFAVPLLDGDEASVERRLDVLLPQPLDQVILQPDLTAIAPGPLRTPLAQTLAVAADVESKGGATVYRFTPESVRRALDAGRSASELHAFLAEHSSTPVPQPLSYLVDDVARRHGRLRIGAASAYLRCDDDALLDELLADRRAAQLRLRRLAPTVLAAQADPAAVLTQLRAMGYAPAAESAEGDVLISRPDARRTPPRTPPAPVPDGPPPVTPALVSAALKAIRAGDRAATVPHRDVTPGGPLPRTPAAETLATLQTAVLTGDPVWIGYVNADGAARQHVIEPVRVEGGIVTAFDQADEEMHTFRLHRITGVAELAQDEA